MVARVCGQPVYEGEGVRRMEEIRAAAMSAVPTAATAGPRRRNPRPKDRPDAKTASPPSVPSLEERLIVIDGLLAQVVRVQREQGEMLRQLVEWKEKQK